MTTNEMSRTGDESMTDFQQSHEQKKLGILVTGLVILAAVVAPAATGYFAAGSPIQHAVALPPMNAPDINVKPSGTTAPVLQTLPDVDIPKILSAIL